MFLISFISTTINMQNFRTNEPSMDEIQELLRVLLILNLLLLVIGNSLGTVFRPKWYLVMLFSTLAFAVSSFLIYYISFRG